MLKPPRFISSWPPLIGIASGTFGAAGAIASGFLLLEGPLRGPSLASTFCSCAFFFLAFPTYVGRDWARRALILTTYCIVTVLAAFLFSTIAPRYPGVSFAIAVCALVFYLTPAAFFLAVLHHPDVRRAFGPKDASNQAMERTAGSFGS
jgi:hypothetical protein